MGIIEIPDTPQERLRQFVGNEALRPASKRLGLSPTALNNLLKGANSPSPLNMKRWKYSRDPEVARLGVELLTIYDHRGHQIDRALCLESQGA
jgi:hypothetical protein